MTTGIPAAVSFFRGQTLQFLATFTDFNGVVTQPLSATLVVWYDAESAEDQELTIPMTQVGNQWQALLDTRNFEAPRKVQWSIHSNANPPLPVAVQDGTFMLSANQANQPTF
jgi:hypothetical protein